MKKMLTTLKGKTHTVPPIWLMRQAGRYLPEYRAVRAEAGEFLDLVYNPKFATEVTLQPLRRYGFDAAILFSDILVVPHALGQHVAFEANHGPVLGNLPPLSNFDAAQFHEVLSPVYQSIASIRSGLSTEGFEGTALIGFSGSPWTLASYMIEQHGSKDFQKARCYAMEDVPRFQKLLDILVQAVSEYCIRQIAAGAEIIQLFDSWAGVLSNDQIKHWVIEPTARIVANIKAVYPNVPIIGFPKGIGVMLPQYALQTGVDSVSLDATMPMEWAVANVPSHIVLQGNLDPLTLIMGGATMLHAVDVLLETASTRPYIFNLGHGIDKKTPPEHVTQLVQHIRSNGI